MSHQPSRMPVKNVALMSDKMGVSDRAAVVLVPSVSSDRHKIRRARKRTRSELSEETTVISTEKLQSIFFDGRKDLTKVKECVSGKTYIKSSKEEHISLIKVSKAGSLFRGRLVQITIN